MPESIDQPAAAAAGEQLLTIIDGDALVLILDMTRTTACDHAGGGMLARVYQRAVVRGTELRLVATDEKVRRVLTLTGVDRLVPLYASVGAALAATAPGESAAPPERAGAARPPAGTPGKRTPDPLPGRHQDATLRRRLGHVYWIGGGSGAGKSTIARRLAARHGLRRYRTDEVMADHGRRMVRADSPFLARFAAMDMDERWVSRSPETMLETFHWFRGEGFGLIVEDLLRLPGGEGVIAEGFRLLPRLVAPLLAAPGQAVWLCPTPGFRRAAFASRGSLREIAGKTSDPDRALRNLLERDRMFTERLHEEATGLGLRVIEVDVTMTEDDLAGQVERALGLRGLECGDDLGQGG